MRYCVSDIHGEYGLFMKLLEKISFSEKDEMYILGDVIDKGPSSVKLLKFVLSQPNMHMILGNHEFDFLKYYRSQKAGSTGSYSGLLPMLRDYFKDGELLDMETVEALDKLPFYIIERDFIGVHSGLPLDSENRVTDPAMADGRELVYDRRFKEPTLLPVTDKCILFGHTTTDNIAGVNRILAYKKPGVSEAKRLSDYCKIHIDTGSWSSGVLGCISLDTLRVVYVYR